MKFKRKIRLLIFKNHGQVISDSLFFNFIVHEIEKTSSDYGYELLINHISNVKDSKRKIKNLIKQKNHSGIIILGTEMTECDIELFKKEKIPMVLVDNYFKNCGIDCIVQNNKEAVFDATQHLIDLGHTEIGYLKSSVEVNNFVFRRQGFDAAMRESGITKQSEYMYSIDPKTDIAYQMIKELIKENSEKLPTVFLADNDNIAFAAVKAIKENGIKVPEEISVVGYDDMPFVNLMIPKLTSVKAYKEEFGKIAVKRLIDKINGDQNIQIITLKSQLVERESVKKLKQ